MSIVLVEAHLVIRLGLIFINLIPLIINMVYD